MASRALPKCITKGDSKVKMIENHDIEFQPNIKPELWSEGQPCQAKQAGSTVEIA